MVPRELIAAALVAVASIAVQAGSAAATKCSAGSSTANNSLFAAAICTAHGSSGNGSDQIAVQGSAPAYTAYKSEPVCFIRAETGGQSNGCPASAPDTCRPGETLFQQFGLHDGTWEALGQFCAGQNGAPDAAPQVTPALVARAFQRIPLPALRAMTQPADRTLINFDTIFYVQATPLHRTLTLLGQRVELEITPSTFRWVHGDGTTAVTQTAGAAYPAKDVVYRYQDAHVTVRHHVEIVWTARWSLNGGPLQDVDGTVTTVGPDTPLRVTEATPALSGYGH